MQEFSLSVALKMRSPTLSRCSAGSALGVDVVPLKVKQLTSNGKTALFPALPGSLLVGNLRHAWKRLATICDGTDIDRTWIDHWLGPETDSGNPEQHPLGRLYRDWAWVADREADPVHTQRVAIDASTGAAATQMLQITEIPYATGTEVDYHGSFRAVCSQEEAQTLANRIKKGLEFSAYLGAFKGIGFGRILSVRVSLERIAVPEATDTPDGDRLSITLTLDRPFCIATPHARAANHLRSETVISGAVIKGAIATRLIELDDGHSFTELKNSMHRLWVSHATPVQTGSSPRRAIPVPLSIYLHEIKKTEPDGSNDMEVGDAIGSDKDELVDKSGRIAFQTDWKPRHWQAVGPLFSGCTRQPEKQLQVRSSIDHGTNVSRPGALFSTELVGVDKHVWVGELDLGRIGEQKDLVRSQLAQVLASGLGRIGKTRARAEVMVSAPVPYTVPCDVAVERDNQTVRLLLTSNADLFDSLPAPGTSAEELQSLYASWFDKNSDGSLALVDFFATQSLYGGDYYWNRFQRRQSGNNYAPRLMTDAGSVFLLSVVSIEQARGILDGWVRYGLRGDMASNDWQSSPVICANGFGRIVADPGISTALESYRADADE